MSFILGGLTPEVGVRQHSDGALMARLWQHLRDHRWKLALVVLALFVNTLSVALVPFVLGRAIDTTSGGPGLWWIVAALNAAALLTWVTQFAHQHLTSAAVADVTLSAQRDALRAALRQDHAFYDRVSSGSVVSRITTDTSTLSGIVNLGADTLNQLLLVILLSGVLVFVSPPLALTLSAIVPIVILVALGFRRLARGAAAQAQESVGALNASIAETMRGIAVAKNYHQEAFLLEQFRDQNRKAYTISLANNRIFGGIFPTLDIVTGLGTALVLYVGGRMVLEGNLTTGSWYLGIQAVTLLLFPLTGIASFWSQFQQGLAATERVNALTDARPEVTETGTQVVSTADMSLRFHGVHLRYGNGPAVLNDLSLEIPAGQRVALIGRTGSGKTSLLRVLMRFYEYQRGTVSVGDRDLRAIEPEERSRLFGLVTQVPMLFDATVAENIRFARPDADDAAVLSAANAIGTNWLEELPQGLETPVGERGVLLSQGQRQLVSLARVMLHDPRIILLDEATANVDSFTEWQVQQGLDALMRERTTVIVAHRLTTVAGADRVILLEDGRVVADGTHRTLSSTHPGYASMYASYFTPDARGDRA
jgi:ATP-binding cassette, subfamily B, bacterial